MGNRAVVVFKNENDKHGVYLHWNGGPDSVLAFLKAMEERSWTRLDYASARFTAVVSEFFDYEGRDEGLSLGIVDDPKAWEAGLDNGIYVVDLKYKNGQAPTFVVKKLRGKAITLAKLDERERASYERIVSKLKNLRALRHKPLS